MNRLCLDPVRSAGLGQRHAGEAADAVAGDSAYLDRGHAAGADPAGRRAGTARWQRIMQSGALVSDEVVNELVEERLSAAGLPRRVLSWTAIRGRWSRPSTWPSGWWRRGIREVVIHLAVDYNIIIARLTGRRQCPRCGTLYNVSSHPPKVDGRVRSGRDEAGDSGRRSARR